MTPQAVSRVQALVLRALESLIELAREPLDYEVEVGDEHVEPYFAIAAPFGEPIVVEGDYRRCVVRVKDYEGRAYVEVDARVPTALSLEPILAWWRTIEWASDRDNDDDADRDNGVPDTHPAPLSAF